MAASRAGKYSLPELSSVSRLPGRNSAVMPGQVRRQRGVVGNLRPRQAVMDFGALDVEATDVDAVQAKHRHGGRETARRSPARSAENLVQLEPACQMLAGPVAPVVEVAGDDQRRIGFGHAVEVVGQRA